jgi:hypothetical protein
VLPEGLGNLEKIHLIGTGSRDLPVCSIVPQPLRYRRNTNRINIIILKKGLVKANVYYLHDKESNIGEEKAGDEFSISFHTCVEISWMQRDICI